MPHRIEDLRETLRELDEELAQVDSLDDESRKLLESAAAEIHEALHKHAAEEKKIEPETWTEQLSDSVREFESSHPNLSRLVGNLINGLAQLGI